MSPEVHFCSERERSISEIGELLKDLGTGLARDGEVTLETQSGERVVTVRPPKNCELRLRYETMPRGELALKIELIWWPTGDAAGRWTDVRVRKRPEP